MTIRLIATFIIFFSLSTILPASEEEQEAKSSNLFAAIARDQKAIWSSPFTGGKDRWKWILPVASTTALLMTQDNYWSKDYRPSTHARDLSNRISFFGSNPFVYGTAGAMYLLGKAGHNEGLSRTGILGMRALINSAIVVASLKLATSRQRPHTGDGDGSFWEGGTSFPSGHSIAIWSLTSAVVNARPRPWFVHVAAYSLASAVSVSRFTGERHYPSDVFLGSTLGYLIGRYVARQAGEEDKVTFLPFMERKAVGLNVVCRW